MNVTDQTPWPGFGCAKFDLAGQKLLTGLVTMCGLNPHTTTIDEMDAVDPICECVAGNDQSSGRLVMRWSTVVRFSSLASFVSSNSSSISI